MFNVDFSILRPLEDSPTNCKHKGHGKKKTVTKINSDTTGCSVSCDLKQNRSPMEAHSLATIYTEQSKHQTNTEKHVPGLLH